MTNDAERWTKRLALVEARARLARAVLDGRRDDLVLELQGAPVRQQDGVAEAVQLAVLSLHLYGDGQRRERGYLYNIIKALDPVMAVELSADGADAVYAKYFAEPDDEDMQAAGETQHHPVTSLEPAYIRGKATGE